MKDAYKTMGEFINMTPRLSVDMSIEEADIARSKAIQIAADKDVTIRFKRRYKSGQRSGKTAVSLPIWVWEEAFKKDK